jgi:hypothetical protein
MTSPSQALGVVVVKPIREFLAVMPNCRSGVETAFKGSALPATRQPVSLRFSSK